MLADRSAIDKSALAREIEAAYGVAVGELRFVPVGLEAYCYETIGEESRLFIRAQDRGTPSALANSLEVAAALRASGLEGVVAPLRTRSGVVCIGHRGFIVAVFPWLEGETWYDTGLDDESLRATGRLLARIHAFSAARLPALVREEYRFTRRDSLLRGLEPGVPRPVAGSRYQQEMRRALWTYRDEILDTLDYLERLGVQLRSEWGGLAVTHGDVTPGNVLVERSGQVALVDWVDVMLGPPERDLEPFVDDRFDVLLGAYVEEGGLRDLSLDRFAFYQYRWILQEIEDYASRLLFGENTPEEEAYYWEDVSEYLPIPHERVQASLGKVEETLRRVANDCSG